MTTNKGQVTIERVYITQKPITINSPSVPKSVNVSFEKHEQVTTKDHPKSKKPTAINKRKNQSKRPAKLLVFLITIFSVLPLSIRINLQR